MSTNDSTLPSIHWHTVCLTIVTISTATIGATIVLADIPGLSPNNGASSVIKATLALIAAGLHIALAGLTGLLIFTGTGQTSQRLALFVYLLFIAIILLLAGILITNLLSDLVIPLLNPNDPAVHYK